MIYPITPMTYQRMTQHSKHLPKFQAYRAWGDEIRMRGVMLPDYGAHIVFHMPMPKSWSKKKRAEMNRAAHQQKPDLDNLVKALLDAVKAGEGDHAIWGFSAEKVWSEDGAISIT